MTPFRAPISWMSDKSWNVVCHQTSSFILKPTSVFLVFTTFVNRISTFVCLKKFVFFVRQKKTKYQKVALLNRDVLCAQVYNRGREAVERPHQDEVRFKERDSNLQSRILLGWRYCSSLGLRRRPDPGPVPADEVGRVSSRDRWLSGATHRTSKAWRYRDARRIGLQSKVNI